MEGCFLSKNRQLSRSLSGQRKRGSSADCATPQACLRMNFSFCTQLNALYEVFWVVWGDYAVSVCGFYEDAVAEVRDDHEGAYDAWDVVVSAVEAGSEKPEAERNQRPLHRLNRFERDSFVAAD